MYQKSHSHFNLLHRLSTDRSQILSTNRNSSYNISQHNINNMIQDNYKSQIIQKQKNKKSYAQQQIERKKSLSSYYFKNYKRTNKKDPIDSFSKCLKNKNQTTKRKRCLTTVNLATNKITPGIDKQKSTQRQLIPTIEIQNNQIQKSKLNNCINHPLKRGYFQLQQAFDCYCHDCSIKNVKNNMNLVHITPQMRQLKVFINKKIYQNENYAKQLTNQIWSRINEANAFLQNQYHQIKKQLAIKSQENNTFYDIRLQQIDWSPLQINIEGQKFSVLQFLYPKYKKYKLNILKNLEKNAQSMNHNTQILLQKINLSFVKSEHNKTNNINKNNERKPEYKKLNLLEQIHKTLYQNTNRKTQEKYKKVKLNRKDILNDKNNFLNEKIANRKQNFQDSLLSSAIENELKPFNSQINCQNYQNLTSNILYECSLKQNMLTDEKFMRISFGIN